MWLVFWLGYVLKCSGNENVSLIEGVLGNIWLVRCVLVGESFVVDLMIYVIEEMGYFFDFLLDLYVEENVNQI